VRLATRFYLLVAAAVVATSLLTQLRVGAELSRSERRTASRQMEHTALIVRTLLADRPFDDALADSLGAVEGLRVTLLSEDGRVLGDSEIEASRLAEVENHAGRPEVIEALAGRTGVAERASKTIAQSLLYVAVPAPGGIIRLAARIDDVTADATRIHLAALTVLLGALLVLIPVCWFFARGISGPLTHAESTLSKLSAGELGARTGIMGRGPLAGVGRAIDRLAGSLEESAERSREEASDLRTLLDSLDEGLAFVDETGILRLTNPAFEGWAGRELEVGARVNTFFRSPEVLGAVDRALGGESVTAELPIGERTLSMSARPHRGGALLVFRDLTALRRLEGIRREFVANVSHELKTPLTSVVGFAEAIAGGEMSSGEAQGFSRRILANASRMRNLIDDLLDLARVESGSWSPSPEPISIATIAREVWRELPDEAPRRGVTLEVDEGDGPLVEADAQSVRQMLRNILGNACRYAPPETPIRLRIITDATGVPDAGWVRIEISDEGQGIPSVHLEHVFERFYRVDPGRSREDGGTGLGLAIVKHLVRAHGGEVGIESEVSRGTTVWFTLPFSSALSGA